MDLDAPKGIYRANTLARINVADKMATPRAQEAYEEMFDTLGGRPCKALLASHWARLVEMVQNAERLQRYCDDPEITGDEFRIVYEQIYKDGEFVPRLMLLLSLSYDHRVIDGADAARFLRFVAESLENPMRLHLEG